ncbi:ATP-binding protein [Streptomyces sp. NPDC091272]|uniref:ATP-binding protein n=1 Tax=Streptomyces sp. NPDC091272 TaxID=3365981 RepID=UPI0037F2B976
MPQGSSTPPAGQTEIADFVRDCWRRRSARPLPLVVLLGRPGSGKTYALDHLAREAEGGITARVDFDRPSVLEAYREQRPYQTALQLAFLLSRKHRGVTPPSFPRLMLGLLAIGLRLPADNREEARTKLKKELASARTDTAYEQAGEVLSSVAETFDLSPVPLGSAVALLVRAFAHLPSEWVLRKSLRSYGAGTSKEGLEALIDLNQLHHSDTPDSRERVDRAMCEAFLDDLVASFEHGSRLYNCLVLLDNIDNRPDVVHFLRTLTSLRAEKARGGVYDPLLLVATSATTRAVPGPADGRPDDPHLLHPDSLSYELWRSRPNAPPPQWWCPVRLRDLDEVEVTQEAIRYEQERARAAGHPQEWVLPGATPLIHRLTYGHPWSVHTLHGVLVSLRGGAPSESDLRGLLLVRPQGAEGPPPDSPVTESARLADLMRERLLAGLGDDQRRAALLIAAARTPRAAVNAGLLGDQPEDARATLMRELRERMWLSRRVPEDAHTRGGRGPSGYLLPRTDERGRPASDESDTTFDTQPVLHPWLRLLLLDALAGPPNGSLESWRALHGQLAHWHRTHHQPLDALYHQLARGGLSDVVDHFTTRVHDPDLVPWLRELYHVTAAPMYHSWLSDEPPRRLATDLARELAPDAVADPVLGRPTAELCAALWLAVDPRSRLPVNRPDLNQKIGALLRQLAAVADADADTLLDEAARYSG